MAGGGGLHINPAVRNPVAGTLYFSRALTRDM
jgi:hypothetical protein